MRKFAGMIVIMAAVAASVFAQTKVITLDGKWTMSITEHAGLPVTLEIKQEGKKLTGNLIIPDHGDLDLVGEFVDGKLTLKSTENGYMQMSMEGEVKADGTLAGKLTSTMGDMNWTGKRLTDD